jgi:hypothetical protein
VSVACCRKRVQKRLGVHWLHELEQRSTIGLDTEEGGLARVEAVLAMALAGEADLNELILPRDKDGWNGVNVHGERDQFADSYTLLTLACYNGHTEAVRRLVSVEGVDLHKVSGLQV